MGHFFNKKVLVMGLGLHGGGVGTIKFVALAGAKVTVIDIRPKKILKSSFEILKKFQKKHNLRHPIQFIFGPHKKKYFLKNDIVIKGPGVPAESPWIVFAKKHKIPITNDINIFFQLCPGKIIGVTGTRGKSTTAYLIWKFLDTHFKKRGIRSPQQRVFLGGNIRKSVLDFLPDMKKNDWAVLELSSFQLYDNAQSTFAILGAPHTARKSPEVALLTNIYRDHLNWHKNLNEYLKAKSYIFKFQSSKDHLFINAKDPYLKRLIRSTPQKKIFTKLPLRYQQIVDTNLGTHYRFSVALAVTVANFFKVPHSIIQKELKRFYGLEGRQQGIKTINGVRFINDTTSTIPEATIAAIERFRLNSAKGKLILIAGGQDKKLDFKNLAKYIIKYISFLILLPGSATEKLKKTLIAHKAPALKIYSTPTMQNAVHHAYINATRGDWIILSPGAASFGQYTNEFDRGKKFVQAVKKLHA